MSAGSGPRGSGSYLGGNLAPSRGSAASRIDDFPANIRASVMWGFVLCPCWAAKLDNKGHAFIVTLTVSDLFTSYEVSKPVSIRPFGVYLPAVLKTARP